MAKKLRFKEAKLEETPNWRKGILSKCAPKDAKKQICVVIFSDEFGNTYEWVPLSSETNQVLDVARKMILAEEMNFPYLENPEPRPDILGLKITLKNMGEPTP